MQISKTRRDENYFIVCAAAVFICYIIPVSLVLIKMTQVVGFESNRIGFLAGLEYVLPRVALMITLSLFFRRIAGTMFIAAGVLVCYYGPWDYLVVGQFNHDPEATFRPSLSALATSSFLCLSILTYGCLLLASRVAVCGLKNFVCCALHNMRGWAFLFFMFIMAYYSLLPMEKYYLTLIWVPGSFAVIHSIIRWALLFFVILSMCCSLFGIRLLKRQHYWKEVVVYLVCLLFLFMVTALKSELFLVLLGADWPYIDYFFSLDYGVLSFIVPVVMWGYLLRCLLNIRIKQAKQLAGLSI